MQILQLINIIPMKSIGVSEDLPDYLRSKYSVSNPSRKSNDAHKPFKPTLLHGVSEESPRHFKLNHIPVLSSTMKNQEISTELQSSRFASNLKQNLPNNKPRFEYSEIKSQKFDYDTLKFVEGMDVKAGNSARIKRAMAYTDQYCTNLGYGFGLSRGEFIVELAQPNVPRSNASQISHINQYLRLVMKKGAEYQKPSHKTRTRMNSNFEIPRQVNTPNRSLRKKIKMRQEATSLVELDLFEAGVKSKMSFQKSTAMYKDY